jgi:ferredoxin
MDAARRTGADRLDPTEITPWRVEMKITLNREACQGHNRCYLLAPEVFDVDDDGYALLRIDGDVPAELQEKARLAAENCPEYAITVED